MSICDHQGQCSCLDKFQEASFEARELKHLKEQFDKDVKTVFGESETEFTPHLRGLLLNLWKQAREPYENLEEELLTLRSVQEGQSNVRKMVDSQVSEHLENVTSLIDPLNSNITELRQQFHVLKTQFGACLPDIAQRFEDLRAELTGPPPPPTPVPGSPEPAPVLHAPELSREQIINIVKEELEQVNQDRRETMLTWGDVKYNFDTGEFVAQRPEDPRPEDGHVLEIGTGTLIETYLFLKKDGYWYFPNPRPHSPYSLYKDLDGIPDFAVVVGGVKQANWELVPVWNGENELEAILIPATQASSTVKAVYRRTNV